MEEMINAGDWVTQYSAGFWKIVELIPKYADEDYDQDGKRWKKGDRLGEWAIVKKAFTPKMKPSNCCEVIDASWCKRVSEETAAAIEALFAQNPKVLKKFENAPSGPKPYVASVWMNLSAEEEKAFSDILQMLPERFSADQLWTVAAAYRHCVTQPPASHILYLYGYPWEMNERFDLLYFEPTVKPFV